MSITQHHDYETVYKSSDEYYWGVEPSNMCLKIIELMPPNKQLKVLDICCGEGKDSVFFARCGYDVEAFDLSDAGVEKTKRLAEKANVEINVYKADICEYRLNTNFDILFSSGALHYIKPELREEIFENYRNHTKENGLNVFNVFVEKPFIAPAPENENNSYLWQSGQLMFFYKDWFIEDFSEYVFDCNSSGVPHQHAMNKIYARRK